LQISSAHSWLYAIVDAADYPSLSRWSWQAWTDNKRQTFYAIRSVKGPDGTKHSVRMHRELCGNEAETVDHKNHDGLDNRRHNLRPCSRLDNIGNQRKRKNGSGRTGAYWDEKTGKYRSVITVRGKRIELGWFLTAEDAGNAYRERLKAERGEFAALGD